MTTRRAFLRTLSAGLATAAASRVTLAGIHAQALTHPATGTIGLQLYSLRHLFEKGDVARTLKLVRSWGFTDVEAAGT
jgi:hypothetical protein